MFKSEAQKRLFAELVKQGKMSQEKYDEWNNATVGPLPERVGVRKVPKYAYVDKPKKEKK